MAKPLVWLWHLPKVLEYWKLYEVGIVLQHIWEDAKGTRNFKAFSLSTKSGRLPLCPAKKLDAAAHDAGIVR